MEVARQAVLYVTGVVLVILGFANFHVQVGAIVVGLILLGVIGGGQIASLIRTARAEEHVIREYQEPKESPDGLPDDQGKQAG